MAVGITQNYCVGNTGMICLLGYGAVQSRRHRPTYHTKKTIKSQNSCNYSTQNFYRLVYLRKHGLTVYITKHLLQSAS